MALRSVSAFAKVSRTAVTGAGLLSWEDRTNKTVRGLTYAPGPCHVQVMVSWGQKRSDESGRKPLLLARWPRPALTLALAAWDPRGAVFPTSHIPSGTGEKGEPTTAGPPRLAHLSSHGPGVTHPSIRPRPRPAPLLPPPPSPGARGNFSPRPDLLCALQALPYPAPPPSQVMLLAAPFQLHTHLSPQDPRLDSW